MSMRTNSSRVSLMKPRSNLTKICGNDIARLDILFVHGLTGDPIETWSSGPEKQYWPRWLCDVFPSVSVYALGYPASVFGKWAKPEMDLHEQANNMLEQLASNDVGKRPIALVTHSLGGILAKEMLRISNECSDDGWKAIAVNVRLVVFLSTPHTGAALASILKFFLPSLSSTYTNILSNSDGYLTNLNESYRDLALARSIKTVSYYEKHKTKNSALIVSRESADPGAGNTRPLAIHADHLSICKPANQNSLIFTSLCRHLGGVLSCLPCIPRNEIHQPSPILTFLNTTEIDVESAKRIWADSKNVDLVYHNDISDAISSLERQHRFSVDFIAEHVNRRDIDKHRLGEDVKAHVKVVRAEVTEQVEMNKKAILTLIEIIRISKVPEMLAIKALSVFGAFAALRLVRTLQQGYNVVFGRKKFWFLEWNFNREHTSCVFDAVPHFSKSGFNAFGYSYFVMARVGAGKKRGPYPQPDYVRVTMPFEIGKKLILGSAESDQDAYFEWVLPQLLLRREEEAVKDFPSKTWFIDRLIGANEVEWHGFENCPWELNQNLRYR